MPAPTPPFGPAAGMPPMDLGPGPEMEAGPPLSDEALMGLAEEVDASKQGLAAEAAPTPTKPYKSKTLVYLRDTLNRLSEITPDIPQIEWEFVQPEGVGSDQWTDPLPAELWVPFFGLAGAIEALNVDGKFDDYVFDPTTATDDATLRDMVTRLDMALKDEEFVTALEAGPGGAPIEGEMPEEEPIEPVEAEPMEFEEPEPEGGEEKPPKKKGEKDEMEDEYLSRA